MSNLTTRLAINIRYLPDFDFNWSDCTPQKPRSSLTIDDLPRGCLQWPQTPSQENPSNGTPTSCDKVWSGSHEDPLQGWKVQKCYYWHPNPATHWCRPVRWWTGNYKDPRPYTSCCFFSCVVVRACPSLPLPQARLSQCVLIQHIPSQRANSSWMTSYHRMHPKSRHLELDHLSQASVPAGNHGMLGIVTW